ncbi:MAG: tRNA (cytidine(34)-2'-O)-methyltransferase [Bacillota bacterium]|nr:tRNA (cytidine(34)-2'-O)-methyltransferase [Bacillota bacterium]
MKTGKKNDPMNVVLVEPEIPPNTGNVARTCVMTGSKLHLVEPLGFSISESQVRRSGLDYWKYLDLEVHADFMTLQKTYPDFRFLYYSTRGSQFYHEIDYRSNDFLVFGSETRGLSTDILDQAEITLRIPMNNQIPRSLNLGNTVALVLYEALRQQNFPGLI